MKDTLVPDTQPPHEMGHQQSSMNIERIFNPHTITKRGLKTLVVKDETTSYKICHSETSNLVKS